MKSNTYFEDGYHGLGRLQLLSDLVNFKLCWSSPSCYWRRSVLEYYWRQYRLSVMRDVLGILGYLLFKQEGIHFSLIFSNLLFDLPSFLRSQLVALRVETTHLDLNVGITLLNVDSSLLRLLECELLFGNLFLLRRCLI
jgi:hypothetical protein